MAASCRDCNVTSDVTVREFLDFRLSASQGTP